MPTITEYAGDFGTSQENGKVVCLLLHLAIVLLPSAILADRLERSSSHGAFKKSIDESRGQGADEEWARDQGKCVRQRTVRQETTNYKAGTLPLNMYQTSDTLRSVGERIVWPSEYDEDQNVNVPCKKSPPKLIWIRHLSMTRSPNQRRMKTLVPRNRLKKLEGKTEN